MQCSILSRRFMLLVLGTVWIGLPLAHVQASSAYAQGVYFPKGTPPTEPLQYDNGSEMRLFIVTQDAVMVDRPESKGHSRAIAYPKYLEPLVAYTQTSDQKYFLVKNPHTSGWGWIAKTFVLEAYEPLRHANAAEPAFLKVLLRSPRRVASHDQVTKVVFFHGPGNLNDTSLHSYGDRICYVYAMRQGEEQRTYMLVGREVSIHPENPAQTLLGWLPQEEAVLWKSQVGISYNQLNRWERLEPVRLFQTYDHMRDYVRTGMERYAMAREDWAHTSVQPYDAMRFPVLEYTPDGEFKVAFTASIPDAPPSGNHSARSASSEAAPPNGTLLTPYMQRLLQDQSDANSALPLAHLQPQYFEGWVPSQSPLGQVQLTYWLLIERSVMDELVGLIASLESLARQSTGNRLSTAIRNTVKRLPSIAMHDEETLSDFFRRRYYMPLWQRATLLRYTPEQLEAKFRNHRYFKKKFLQNFGRKYVQLQSVIEETDVTLEWNAVEQRWHKTQSTKKKWWWTTSSGATFAWIPFDYLP